jgi:cytochrome b
MIQAPLQAVRVWDLPTRLFHVLLAASVIAAVVSAKIGGNAMVWHFRFGLAVLALLVFRFAWGLLGGHWSRFGSFLHGPGALWRYLRRAPRPGERLDVGHSPLGALSVWALLGLLAVQVGTGLVADDEIATVGPLSRFVEIDTALAATSWHKGWGQDLLLAAVALHVLAIIAYRVFGRTDLAGPMVHGDKRLPADTPASADGTPQRLLALALAGAAAALAVWVSSLALPGF